MRGATDVASASTALEECRRVRRVLAATQVVFFVTLASCVAWRHGHRVDTEGISYFGVHWPTIPLLVAGFLAGAAGLWRVAASSVAWPTSVPLGLRLIAFGLVALLLTPYTQGTFFNWAHMSVGVAVALTQLAVSFALTRRAGSASLRLGLVVQVVGGLIAAASLPDWDAPYLLLGQSIYQVGFAACLFEWLRRRLVENPG